ncbi:MAG TPA: hypothetical protein VGJ57_04950 [Nitrospirales bacterium]|jgi:hypothetical protein
MVGLFMVLFVLLGTLHSMPDRANAQSLGRDTQTSSSCQIGAIKKGATGTQCDVPIPPTCTVATNIATKTHWSDIQKSGGISCRFDPKKTDWKTRIAGSCGKCEARQCTAKFTVYFDCPQPVQK